VDLEALPRCHAEGTLPNPPERSPEYSERAQLFPSTANVQVETFSDRPGPMGAAGEPIHKDAKFLLEHRWARGSMNI
jgi:hypothetical protein